MSVPYTFATATSSIPLSQLDSNFATAITLGGTNLYLGNTTTTVTGLTLTGSTFTGNVTTSNAVITGGTIDGTTVGATTASTGAFTTLSASSTVSGTGFSTYLASPPAIGGTTAAAGSFTNLSSSGTVSGTGFSTYLASPPAIGGTTPSTGKFTTLTSTSDASIHGLTVGLGAGSVYSNMAFGANALSSNTTGNQNTALGGFNGYVYALGANTSGSSNTAVGSGVLGQNTTGSNNTALGQGVMNGNTTGGSNTAIGGQALYSNTTSNNNTAVGYQAGYSQTTFGANTFIGYQAGYTQNNTSSYTYNTFVGYQAGYATTTAVKCTILGGYNGNQGGLDIRTSSNYIVLSDGDGNPRGIFDGSGNFLVGTTSAINSGVSVVTGTNTVQLNLRYSGNASGKYYALGSWSNNGSSFVIQSNTGAGVALASESAQSWSSYSDVRLKNITGKIENALNGIMQLEPIRFSWKRDSENKPQVGISAQSILPIVPEAVDESENFMDLEDKNKYYMVRYTELIPLLTAAIQELKAEFDAYKASHP